MNIRRPASPWAGTSWAELHTLKLLGEARRSEGTGNSACMHALLVLCCRPPCMCIQFWRSNTNPERLIRRVRKSASQNRFMSVELGQACCGMQNMGRRHESHAMAVADLCEVRAAAEVGRECANGDWGRERGEDVAEAGTASGRRLCSDGGGPNVRASKSRRIRRGAKSLLPCPAAHEVSTIL